MKTSRVKEKAVAIAILQYLCDHPQAKDNAKGIARWWVHEKQEVVVRALRLLVEEGVLEKVRHVYGLAPRAEKTFAEGGDKTKQRHRKRK